MVVSAFDELKNAMADFDDEPSFERASMLMCAARALVELLNSGDFRLVKFTPVPAPPLVFDDDYEDDWTDSNLMGG